MASYSESEQTALPARSDRIKRSGRAASRDHRRFARRDLVLRFGFFIPALVYLIVFCLYPIYYTVQTSFRDVTAATFVSGDAPWVGIENYLKVFSSPEFFNTVTRTVIFVGASIIGQYVIGMLLALFFQRNFPLNALIRALLLLPWLLPVIVSTTIFRWMYDQDSGVFNEMIRALVPGAHIEWLSSGPLAMLSVIVVQIWIGIPFAMVVFYSGIKGIPGELYEAAALDGASAIARFRYVTLPQLRPVSAVVLTLSLIYTLKSFDVIYIMTAGGPANATRTLAIDSYLRSFTQFDFGTGASVGTLLVIISVTFALFYLRSYRKEA